MLRMREILIVGLNPTIHLVQVVWVKAPNHNRFYALQTRGDCEILPDVVTSMSIFFQTDVYLLLDHGATLSFVPYMAIIFYVFLKSY